MTTQALGTFATRNVPRYTSYPTAPHFHDGISAEEYAGWLAELDPDKPVSLYLHVPFCRQLCWYCGCNMKLASKDGPIISYASTLMREIRLLARHLPARMKVSHLHWGGGTPTALTPYALTLAMDMVQAEFEILPDAELAIESDPRTLTPEMIARIGHIGFNRASFGVQEFDRKVQTAINRIQPPAMVKDSVDGLRAAGVSGINFDLIYGLPHQTTETLLKTIDLCAQMRPDRIALFGYAHVPWMAKKQRLIDEAALPDSAARIEQAQASTQALIDAGYEAIGLDHFALHTDPLAKAARTGTLRRNFQGYTTDTADTLLGIGATSIGRTPAGYVQNIAETGAWARSVENGTLPIGKGIALSAEDRMRGEVIEHLMCRGAVNLAEIAAAFDAPKDWYVDAEAELAELAEAGVLVRDADRISVTESGMPLVRVVASLFDAYLGNRAGRHAVAV